MSDNNNPNHAADLVRQKIQAIHANEPDAVEEAVEVFAPDAGKLSKHQAYMRQLSTSGRSLADIQTAWHTYYASLPDKEKHEVWQEFYAEHNKAAAPLAPQPTPAGGQAVELPRDGTKANVHQIQNPPPRRAPAKTRTVSEVKRQLLGKANTSASTKLKAKQHFQSLLFGVGMGLIVVVILLFSFFNDRFIAPFITPSKNVSATPIIIDSSSTIGSEPKVIIPKINVEIPVVYDEPSVEEHALQNALERGVVHYRSTANPGELGNAVIFGHSSNNILNKGKYKFAFVLLNRMEIGDTFYLNKDGVRYGYRIYQKKIVPPTDLSVLGAADKPATATLITCDPPGTSLNRLIVVGEQISPDPASNKASTAAPADGAAKVIPSNAPSLWQRITDIFN